MLKFLIFPLQILNIHINGLLTGKTLICKERAIRHSEENPTSTVFYISTVGTHKNGNPRNELFMFDVITKQIEMKHTTVTAIDTIDLLRFYNSYHPTFQTYLDVSERTPNKQMKKKQKVFRDSTSSFIDVYELLTFFIDENVRRQPEAHFIIDELPIFMDGNSSFW